MKDKNLYHAIGQVFPNGSPKVIGTFATEKLAAQKSQKFVDDRPGKSCGWVETGD
jgi:hypothetical protein